MVWSPFLYNPPELRPARCNWVFPTSEVYKASDLHFWSNIVTHLEPPRIFPLLATMRSLDIFLGIISAAALGVDAGSLKDIKHVVMLMQENRAFDHVRSFSIFCSHPQIAAVFVSLISASFSALKPLPWLIFLITVLWYHGWSPRFLGS